MEAGGLLEHRDRRLIDAETHARPVPPIVPPLRVRRLAFMSGNGGGDLTALHAQMAEVAHAVAEGPAWARQLAFTENGREVTWEVHNEFATLTWAAPVDEWDPWPRGIGLELHRKMPLIMATRIDLIPAETIAEAALAGFSPLSLAYSSVFDGSAEVATDFRLDEDGYTRFEVAAGRMGVQRCGVLVRRLLEIETYRTIALLGLPLARELGGKVTGYEQRLAAITSQDGDTVADHQRALADLHGLSMEITRTVEQTSFRFAATQAYGEVLAERLGRLRERAIGEFTTLERFINNRAQPALATCRATEKRLAGLTDKVQRSIGLLDARITLSIQTQNKSVLDAISQTARSQYRLQLTVEGLSIIAISYYALGLLGYIYEGLHEVLPLAKGEMLALTAPVVVLLVFLGIRRLRKQTH